MFYQNNTRHQLWRIRVLMFEIPKVTATSGAIGFYKPFIICYSQPLSTRSVKVSSGASVCVTGVARHGLEGLKLLQN